MPAFCQYDMLNIFLMIISEDVQRFQLPIHSEATDLCKHKFGCLHRLSTVSELYRYKKYDEQREVAEFLLRLGCKHHSN